MGRHFTLNLCILDHMDEKDPVLWKAIRWTDNLWLLIVHQSLFLVIDYLALADKE